MPQGVGYKGRTSATLKDYKNPSKRKQQAEQLKKRRKKLSKDFNQSIYGR